MIGEYMATQPLYDLNDVVYLKESAALGFLEAVTIGGIRLTSEGWSYTIKARASLPQAPSFMGDRISAVHGATLYFSEDEFVDKCDALALVEANLQRQLDRVQAQRESACADVTG